jgi:5-methylcytosine-specific restriction endonuclease McrA
MQRTDVDVDHKIPFCYGGGHERTNLQLAHPSCNRSRRSSVDPRDLLRYLEDRYMNR